MTDDRGVDEDVERLRCERSERRQREAEDLAVVRRAEPQDDGLTLRLGGTTCDAGRLRHRLDHDLVEVHVRRPREREEHAVGDLVRA